MRDQDGGTQVNRHDLQECESSREQDKHLFCLSKFFSAIIYAIKRIYRIYQRIVQVYLIDMFLRNAL